MLSNNNLPKIIPISNIFKMLPINQFPMFNTCYCINTDSTVRSYFSTRTYNYIYNYGIKSDNIAIKVQVMC